MPDMREEAVELAALVKPVDQELFNRTAPKWNCVDYVDGMHYVDRNGDCLWCGKTREQRTGGIPK